jgi:hypothetical protein
MTEGVDESADIARAHRQLLELGIPQERLASLFPDLPKDA